MTALHGERTWLPTPFPVLTPARPLEPLPSETGLDTTERTWRDIDEAFPASAPVGVALVPWVVELAARRSPAHRSAHVAFVANVAFGGRRDAGRIDAPLADLCYRSTTATAHRLLRDASRGRVWEEWESRWMIGACARILGRLRSARETPQRAAPRAEAADFERELVRWLLAGTDPGDEPVVADRTAGSTGRMRHDLARIRPTRPAA